MSRPALRSEFTLGGCQQVQGVHPETPTKSLCQGSRGNGTDKNWLQSTQHQTRWHALLGPSAALDWQWAQDAISCKQSQQVWGPCAKPNKFGPRRTDSRSSRPLAPLALCPLVHAVSHGMDTALPARRAAQHTAAAPCWGSIRHSSLSTSTQCSWQHRPRGRPSAAGVNCD